MGLDALWDVLLTVVRGATAAAAEKEPPKKSQQHVKHTSSRLQGIRTQNCAMRPSVGPPAKSMCVSPRHRLLLVDVVGRSPLSSMCFGLVSHGADKKRQKSQKTSTATPKSTSVHVHGPCTIKTERCAFFPGCLQRVCVCTHAMGCSLWTLPA